MYAIIIRHGTENTVCGKTYHHTGTKSWQEQNQKSRGKFANSSTYKRRASIMKWMKKREEEHSQLLTDSHWKITLFARLVSPPPPSTLLCAQDIRISPTTGEQSAKTWDETHRAVKSIGSRQIESTENVPGAGLVKSTESQCTKSLVLHSERGLERRRREKKGEDSQ